MSEKFLNILRRNFPEDALVHVGINKKFYAQKHPDERIDTLFQDIPYKINVIESVVRSLREKFDLYICFTPCEGKQRKKPNAKDSFVIAQDIDGVPIPEDLPPSYYWETSPGKFQGVWILDNAVTPQEHEIICRKLIKKYNFDPCGSDIVHFYRIPSTRNHKYASTFPVSVMKGDGNVYRKRDIIKHLKDVDITTSVVTNNEPIEYQEYDLEELLLEYSVKQEFYNTLGSDRSEWAWNIESKMFFNGASKEEVKFALLNAPAAMAKFTEKNVDAEINRVFAKVEAEAEEIGEELGTNRGLKRLNKSSDGIVRFEDTELRGKKPPKAEISIKRVDEIEPFDPTDFWLIEDLWENNSVGVIGAPSKSFKSTLTLNLACAVATGKPFDGREVKQGAVLIIQGENNISMEQHKIYSITGETELPIYFVDDNITMDHIWRLKNSIIKLGIKLLIIDPMYLLFGSGDINKHQDIVLRLEMLSNLSKATNCSIMLVHHSRKLERGAKIQTSDLYGSAFIEGWYESMILLQRQSNNSSRMVTYFRNHKSGDVYDLVVDDNMSCKAYKMNDDSGYETNKMELTRLTKKEKEQFENEN